ITGESPWRTPMKIYPAPHYSMGGLWVDYTLQTTIPGLFAIGEANFSDHGANRLGASAMMQCLADGYFILPHCVTDYLADVSESVDAGHEEFGATRERCHSRLRSLLDVGGKTPATVFHRRLGAVMLDRCGITRDADGLQSAISDIREIREEYWRDLRVDGEEKDLNQSLEYAGRVADFLEFAETMCLDALEREESCGCHLRSEHQTEEGEAVRNDARFAHAQVWEYTGPDSQPELHHEELGFEVVEPSTRSYK
ncbi:MAG: FAD-binding protein, partial [Thermoleophilia bacterium]|nr:FAD-binding protein [Thermoleophilia bacterium]